MEFQGLTRRFGVLVVILAAGHAAAEDCNGNTIEDSDDLLQRSSSDCNLNGVPDECDVATGVAADSDQNGIPDACERGFVRGDPNADGAVSLSDAMGILTRLFHGEEVRGYCLDAADVDDDGRINFVDPQRIFNDLFTYLTPDWGSAIPEPHPVPGLDPTAG